MFANSLIDWSKRERESAFLAQQTEQIGGLPALDGAQLYRPLAAKKSSGKSIWTARLAPNWLKEFVDTVVMIVSVV